MSFDCLPSELQNRIYKHLDAKSRVKFKIAHSKKKIIPKDTIFERKLFIVENYIDKHPNKKLSSEIFEFLKKASSAKENDLVVQELCKKKNLKIEYRADNEIFIDEDFLANTEQILEDISRKRITKERMKLYDLYLLPIDKDYLLQESIAKNCTRTSLNVLLENDNIKDLIRRKCGDENSGSFLFTIINYINEDLLQYVLSLSDVINIDIAKEYLYRISIMSIFVTSSIERIERLELILNNFHDIPKSILIDCCNIAEEKLFVDSYFLLSGVIKRIQ
jgi:hypothetical protein